MKRVVKRIFCLSFVACLLGLWYWLGEKPEQLSRATLVSEQRPTQQAETGSGLRRNFVPIVSPPKVAGAKENREKIKRYLLSHHPAALESSIGHRDPFLGRYRLLSKRKVLLSAEETVELDEILNDRDRRSVYLDYLSRVDFTSHAFAEEQVYRLFLLQYFESILSSQKDAEIADFMVNFVLEDNFGAELSQEMKKALAYEKIKVLNFLKENQPKSLELIQQKILGTRHEKLLRESLQHQAV